MCVQKYILRLGLFAIIMFMLACCSRQPAPMTADPLSTSTLTTPLVVETSTKTAISPSPTGTFATAEPTPLAAWERLGELDNRYIYYISTLDTVEQDGQRQSQIWRASLDHQEQTLVHSRVTYSGTVVWEGTGDEDWLTYHWSKLTLSPDKQTLAFAVSYQHIHARHSYHVSIWTISVDGTNLQKRATFDSDLIVLELAWSPDGSKLGLVLEHIAFVTPRTVAVIDLDTNDVMQYEEFSGFAFAPQGQDLVLGRSLGGDNLQEIGLHRITEKGVKNILLVLEPGQPFYPAWSPDGTEIVYSRSTPNLQESSPIGTFSLHLDSGRVRQLATTGATYPIKWSPDGQFIAFVDEEKWPPRVDVIDRDGNLVHTFAEEFYLDVQWSDDSKAILANSAPTGHYMIAFVDDGTTVIVPNKGEHYLTW